MTAKLNRAVRCAAAVLAVVAVGAGATACDSSSGSTSSKAAGANSGTSDGSSSSTQNDSQNGSQGSTKGSDSGTGDTARGGSQGKAEIPAGTKVKTTAQQGSRTDAVNASSAATSSRCHTTDLGYDWGGPHGGAPDMKDSTDQQIASVKLTNRGDRTCTLHGFPGVRLVSKTGEAWDLRRSSDTPSTMTLRPGESTASVSITLLAIPADSKDTKPFVPSKVLITPPNETTHVTLDWPYGGAILDQSGATHPGTFVSPIGI
ncbi:DUF4232 domain-containing protein [Streptomyces sp. NPDC059398]|uniref:DUF4232 domain-containing protein n=1 Tax=Streptomyces sp. NPDC059398 TaxID=3346820 RepID=UPI0036CD9558